MIPDCRLRQPKREGRRCARPLQRAETHKLRKDDEQRPAPSKCGMRSAASAFRSYGQSWWASRKSVADPARPSLAVLGIGSGDMSEQRLRAFLLYCLEFIWVQPEQFQDGRGYLRGFHRFGGSRAAERDGILEQDWDIAIFGMIAAGLGDFSFFASVNDAVLGEANDVRHAGISGGDTDEPRGRRAGVNLCQTGGGDGFAVHADGRVGIIHEELAGGWRGGVGTGGWTKKS